MTTQAKKQDNRLFSALKRVRDAAKRLWTAIVNAVRGREHPLPEHIGTMRRIGIAVVGTVSLVLFLSMYVPNLLWASGRILTEQLAEDKEAPCVTSSTESANS
jgi:hypothetical protein